MSRKTQLLYVKVCEKVQEFAPQCTAARSGRFIGISAGMVESRPSLSSPAISADPLIHVHMPRTFVVETT